MQTFLPFPDFAESAAVLDGRRLANQRNETLAILGFIAKPDSGYQNHPAVNQWRGYEGALVDYGEAMCFESQARGIRDDEDLEGRIGFYFEFWGTPAGMPPWLGDERMHRSHRSNLVRKDHVYYRPKFEADLPDDLPYYWPSKDPEQSVYKPTQAELRAMKKET